MAGMKDAKIDLARVEAALQQAARRARDGRADDNNGRFAPRGDHRQDDGSMAKKRANDALG